MHKKYFLVIYAIFLYSINITAQVVKDKNAFIKAVIGVFDTRNKGFDSILTGKNLGTNKGFTSKILLPGADECYINSSNYYAHYSFKDSVQAITFFKEVQGLLTDAATAYSANVRFVPEPDNPYYLKFHLGNAEAFIWQPDLINMFQHVLNKDYKEKGGIPLHGTDKMPANPYSLYLILDGVQPVTGYFTSQGDRIVNNEIINLVKEIGFGKDTQMIQFKKNKKVTDEGNTFESKRTLKGYKATIFESDEEDATRNSLELLQEWTGKKDQDVFNKRDSLVLSLKAALPAAYCYIVNNNEQKVFFYPHPFTNEKPDANFVINYGVVDPKKKNFYYLALTIERLIEKQMEKEEPAVKQTVPDLIPFKNSGGKYGYKNEAGEIVVAARYDEADGFIEERGKVKLNKKYGFIDINGKEIIPLQYDYASSFINDDLTEVQLNRKWGMIDKTGKISIPIQYDEISRGNLFYNEKGGFHKRNKFIMVKLNGKYGFVDSAGRVAVPLKYDYAHIIENGVARVKINNKEGVIDYKGKEFLPIIYDAMNTDDYSKLGIIRVKQNGKWGLVDKSGKLIIAANYDYTADGFSEGLAWVRLNDKAGFVDKSGKEIIPLKYNGVGNFSNGLASARLNEKCGYIDMTGKEIIAFKYENGGSFAQGLAAVKINGKWGYIDKTGKTVIPFKYDGAEEFDKNGEAKVYIGKKWGKINKKGEIVKTIVNENDEDDWEY